jgi:hypothetical protein
MLTDLVVHMVEEFRIELVSCQLIRLK